MRKRKIAITYGICPKKPGGIFLAFTDGGNDKNPDREALLLLTTATSTVMVIPVARPITVSAAELSRRRSISLPVVRVRVEMF